MRLGRQRRKPSDISNGWRAIRTSSLSSNPCLPPRGGIDCDVAPAQLRHERREEHRAEHAGGRAGHHQGADARPNGFMSIPFVIISVLGLTVFYRAGGWPVGVLFTGLALVYVAEFFASFKLGVTVAADGEESTNVGEKALGVVHVVVGAWLMYLTVATTLDITSGFHLPGA